MTETERPARILLVEDNRMDVELAQDAFEQAHVENVVEVARTGREAIDRLLGRPLDADGRRSPLPDLILLDLKLPGNDGIDVLRRVKETPSLRRIPVVILTSSREEGDRANAYDAGANSYLVKPVSVREFATLVRCLLDYWSTINVPPPRPADDRDGGPRGLAR